VKKNLSPQTHGDEHIVCYIVDGKLRFGFLDPNEDELFSSEQEKIQSALTEVSIFQLAEEYCGYSRNDIKDAPDLELADIEPLIRHITNFDK